MGKLRHIDFTRVDFSHVEECAMQWPEVLTEPSVRLSELIDELTAHLLRYVHFTSPDIAPVVAMWVVQTYCFTDFYYCGYIAIRSQLPGSGKSRLLEVLSALCWGNPPYVTNPTPAILFRDGGKVWLIDEVDNLRSQDTDTYGVLMSVLNSGFERNGKVPRLIRKGDDFEPRHFSTFGPKVFAGLQMLTDTLNDRSFHIPMQKATGRVPRLSVAWLDKTAPSLRKRLEELIGVKRSELRQTYEAISDYEEVPLLARYDYRFQDISEPLLVIALLADAEYGGAPRMVQALQKGLRLLVGGRKPDRHELAIHTLLDLEGELMGGKREKFIPSQQVLETFRRTGAAWMDSTKDLAQFLNPLGLSPRSNGKVHGYDFLYEWFLELKNSIRQGVGAAPVEGY